MPAARRLARAKLRPRSRPALARVLEAGILPEGMDVVAIYSESDLVVPALAEIERYPEGIETAALLIALRRTLRPEGDDLLLLEGRADDRFSQKVRNLKSHDTLERQGFAIYDEASGKYHITDKGRRLVEAGEGVTESLVRQGFSPGARRVAQDRDFEGIVVEEGSYRYLEQNPIILYRPDNHRI